MQVIKKKERIEININNIVYGGKGIGIVKYKNSDNFIVFVKNFITSFIPGT